MGENRHRACPRVTKERRARGNSASRVICIDVATKNKYWSVARTVVKYPVPYTIPILNFLNLHVQKISSTYIVK